MVAVGVAAVAGRGRDCHGTARTGHRFENRLQIDTDPKDRFTLILSILNVGSQNLRGRRFGPLRSVDKNGLVWEAGQQKHIADLELHSKSSPFCLQPLLVGKGRPMKGG